MTSSFKALELFCNFPIRVQSKVCMCVCMCVCRLPFHPCSALWALLSCKLRECDRCDLLFLWVDCCCVSVPCWS